jgi:hypothetical protein
VPDRFGAPFFAIVSIATLLLVLVGRRRASALVFVTTFVVAAAAVTYLLFNLVWVDDPLAGGFLLFVPLALVPMLLLATADWNRAVFAACVVVAVCPQMYWTAKWFGLRNGSSLEDLAFPTGFVTPAVILSVDYPHGPPVRTSRGLVVSPNSFHADSRPQR